MNRPAFLIYGATGYTGALTAAHAAARGLAPVLAGRSEERVRAVAEPLGLAWLAFGLDDTREVARELRDANVGAVLHCAGPFVETSAHMLEACLDAGVHYLDITGEIPVFEACFARDADARAAGITVLPGVGVDVVPTDCIAAVLAEALPNATTLELAISGVGRASRGTLRSALGMAARGGLVRRAGDLARVPVGRPERDVPFADRARHCVAIPWGDLVTAHRSTGIPNITTYLALPISEARAVRLAGFASRLLAVAPARALAERWIDRQPAGPSERSLARGRAYFWGRVEDASGESRECVAETPQGYAFTATASVECAERVLDGRALVGTGGTTTPARAFGPRFLAELPECSLTLRA